MKDEQNPVTKIEQGNILTPDFADKLRAHNLSAEETMRIKILVGKGILRLSAITEEEKASAQLTTDETEYLDKLGPIHDDDYTIIEDDPRVLSTRKELFEARRSRSKYSEATASKLNQLTEWQVVIELLELESASRSNNIVAS